MPRMEEEVVIRKRLVVKEKIRIRKHVVEDEEIIEVPVRKEEVRIEDETRRRDV
jgi:stress response protein YsnF